uniref:Collagen alpha-1(I) chain-like n=1 Tax=Macrostomum lignano TaxID=282301 RepID=A0A1I8HET9_9PLAT
PAGIRLDGAVGGELRHCRVRRTSRSGRAGDRWSWPGRLVGPRQPGALPGSGAGGPGPAAPARGRVLCLWLGQLPAAVPEPGAALAATAVGQECSSPGLVPAAWRDSRPELHHLAGRRLCQPRSPGPHRVRTGWPARERNQAAEQERSAHCHQG